MSFILPFTILPFTILREGVCVQDSHVNNLLAGETKVWIDSHQLLLDNFELGI